MENQKAFIRDRARVIDIVYEALRQARKDLGETFRLSVDGISKYIDGESPPSRATLYRAVNNLADNPPDELTVTRAGIRGNYIYSFVGATSIDGDGGSAVPTAAGSHRRSSAAEKFLAKVRSLSERNRQLEDENRSLRQRLSSQAIEIEKLRRQVSVIEDAEQLLSLAN